MLKEKIKNSDDSFLQLIIRHANLARFVFTGGINTMCDLFLFAIFANILSIHPVTASLLSTGITLVLSFFLNNHFVFKSNKQYRDTAILFVILTLFNVWLVQSSVLYLSLLIIRDIPFFATHQWTANMLAKVCGISVSMVLNYIGYKKIFRGSHDS